MIRMKRSFRLRINLRSGVTYLLPKHTVTKKGAKRVYNTMKSSIHIIRELNTVLLTAWPWAERGSCSTLGLFFFIFFLSETRRRSPLGQLWIMQSVMFTRQTLFLQGQQKCQITKSRRTYTLQKNLFKTLTSKRYITLALIATSYRQIKIYSLTIQLHHIKISTKSNKTRTKYY